jgi:hypothetical protein
MTLRGGRARLATVLSAMCGCLAENPAYDPPAAGESEGATSTAGSTTTGTSAETTDGTGASGTEASSSKTEATTSVPMSASLRHYEPSRCLEPLWCFADHVWNGLPGEVRGAECFSAPMPPPFRVRRIDYHLVATREQPTVRFEVRSGDLQRVLYASEPQALAATGGSLAIPEAAQPVVEEARFCVSFVGGDAHSTVGFGADAGAPPLPLQSFFGADACQEPGLRDVNLFTPEIVPRGAWCLGAEIAGL